jgi:RNA polymerase sigma-70 factor (ECF subfamily)
MGVVDMGKVRAARGGGALSDAQAARFDALYRDHFDFVYRNLRRLGVAEGQVDDALQEVYLVVLRRIAVYEEGTQARAWLYAIAARVASNHRRGERRRGTPDSLSPEALPHAGKGPFERVARHEAREVLHAFLDGLDEAKRHVFVMAELEQMTAPEISETLGVNVNTVYARLRAARRELARLTTALRVAEGGRSG